METRWRRFRAGGPPPSPVADQAIAVRIRGGDSARIVLDLRSLGIAGLVAPFSEEIHFGERIGVIGPNGSGKSALMNVLAGARDRRPGELRTGPRVSIGLFTQLQSRADFSGRVVLDIVMARRGEMQAAMGALARYGLAEAARRPYDVLSGGEKARLEVLILELEGHNLLLLDEPTDNLDTDSSEALEKALDSFEGTVVAVSHDRAFLRRMDRFLMVLHDGGVLSLPSYDSALEALLDPERAPEVRLAKPLSAPGDGGEDLERERRVDPPVVACDRRDPTLDRLPDRTVTIRGHAEEPERLVVDDRVAVDGDDQVVRGVGDVAPAARLENPRGVHRVGEAERMGRALAGRRGRWRRRDPGKRRAGEPRVEIGSPPARERQPAAGDELATDVRERGLGLVEEHHAELADHGIERSARHGLALDVGDDERDVAARPAPRHGRPRARAAARRCPRPRPCRRRRAQRPRAQRRRRRCRCRAPCRTAAIWA